MITRALAFLTDMIIFLLAYCFLFVSVLILFVDRNTDYDQFLPVFYIVMAIAAYLYFLLPLLLWGKTLGKRIFKIKVVNHSSVQDIIMVHVKYIFGRLLPFVALLLVFELDPIWLKIIAGLLTLYPVFDYIYLRIFEHTLTDKLLKLEIKVY